MVRPWPEWPKCRCCPCNASWLFFCLCIAFVKITPLDRAASRDDIECPGDIMPYNCSIQSNSEALHLTWRVTLHGQTLFDITYPNASINVENSYITTSLTGYSRDEFIHSTLEFTVQLYVPSDQIIVACSIDDLGNSSTIIVPINTSGKNSY